MNHNTCKCSIDCLIRLFAGYSRFDWPRDIDTSTIFQIPLEFVSKMQQTLLMLLSNLVMLSAQKAVEHIGQDPEALRRNYIKEFHNVQTRLNGFLSHTTYEADLYERIPISYIDGDQSYVVAAVGPPARGKSFTFAILQEYAAIKGLKTYLHNAGDIRRIWEKLMVSHPNRLGAYLDYYMVPNNDRQDWYDWVNTQPPAAVPGHLFATKFGKELNNYFAMIAMRRMFTATGSAVHYFDATNTDIHRRAVILQMAQQAKRNVLFIENICTNTQLLLRNFLTKVMSSGDYKSGFARSCNTVEVKTIMHLLEGVSLLASWDSLIRRTAASSVCQQQFILALSDIIERDRGYLTRYVPLSSGSTSTVDQINEFNHVNAGSVHAAYIQTMISACSPNGQAQQRSNLMDNPLRRMLRNAQPKDQDTYNRRQHLYDEMDIVPPQVLFRDPLVRTTLEKASTVPIT